MDFDQIKFWGYVFEAGGLTQDRRSSRKDRIEGRLRDKGLLVLKHLMTDPQGLKQQVERGKNDQRVFLAGAGQARL